MFDLVFAAITSDTDRVLYVVFDLVFAAITSDTDRVLCCV